MATSEVNLPPGFVLDDPSATLPPGFVLDKPEQSAKSSGYEIPMGQGVAREALQGATFGWSDEIGSGIAAAAAALTGENFSDVYNDIVSMERKEMEMFREQHPGVALGSEIAGMVPTAGIGAATRPLVTAVAGGALYGAGTQEGWNKALGAAGGGALGGATYGALRGLTAGAKWMASTKAGKLIQDELRNLGKSLDDVMRELKELGPEGRLMDVAPGLAKTAKRMGSDTIMEDALNTRAKGQQGRLVDAVKSFSKTTGEYYDNLAGLEDLRAKQAQPLYDAAYNAALNVTDDFKKLFMVGDKVKPSISAAWGKARELFKDEGVDIGKLDLNNLTVKTVDQIKRGLDSVIEANTKDFKLNQKGRVVLKLKNQILDTVDDMVPEYKAARAAWAGPSSVIDAQKLGRQILRNDMEISENAVTKMSAAEKEGFVIGAVRAIRDKIMSGADTHNMTRRFNELARERLRPVFDSEDQYKAFIKTLENEDIFSMTRNKILGGSDTAENLNRMGRLAADIGSKGIAGTATDRVWKIIERAGEINARTAKDIAEIMVDANMSEAAIRKALRNKVSQRVLNSIISAAGFGTAVTAEKTVMPNFENPSLANMVP